MLFNFERHSDRPAAIPLVAVAALAVGMGLQPSNGALHPAALAWVTTGFAITLMAALAPGIASLDRFIPAAAFTLLGVAFMAQFGELLTTPPGIYLRPGPKGFVPFLFTLGIAAI